MQINVEAHGFTDLAAVIGKFAEDFKAELPTFVRQASYAAELRIKGDMPVLTGRAQGSWGHFTGGGDESNPAQQPGDSLWKEEDGGLTIEQGSRVDYVPFLNEGSSTKAPAGFVDAAAEAAVIDTVDDMAEYVTWKWSQ